MIRLNFVTLCFVIIFLINTSHSSLKNDNKNTTETVQTNSPKEELNAEVIIPVREANTQVAPENVSKGEKLFKEKNCAVCHQLDSKLVGPALKVISKTYAGKKEKLNSFLKGDSKSIIDPAQHAIMEPQIAITKAMSEEDRMAIVEYLLSIK